LIKNFQPFRKNFQKTVRGIFLTHILYTIHIARVKISRSSSPPTPNWALSLRHL